MLKVWRPEGGRLVLVGTSALEAVPAGKLATFTCSIPVARNDVVGCSCPDSTCIDRFADGVALRGSGDLGTADLAVFSSTVGTPAVWAGGSTAVTIPSPAGRDLVLPVVGRTPGLGGTRWSTSLELFATATDRDTSVALYLNLSDRDSTTPAAAAYLTVRPRGTVVLEDLLETTFGVDQGTGSVDLVASDPILAHARVATTTASGGSYGQKVPAVPAGWAAGEDDAPGLDPNVDLLYLFEVREDERWRTNVGLANVTGVPLEVEVQAYGPLGATGGPLLVNVPPFSHTQITRILTVMNLPDGTDRARLNLRVVPGSAARFLAYASRVDNRTGDPVFLLADRQPALPDQ
jgi:hypothetical protein